MKKNNTKRKKRTSFNPYSYFKSNSVCVGTYNGALLQMIYLTKR